MTDVTKFIDKETGEIHIGEVVNGPETRWDDIEKLAPYAEVDGNDEVCCLTIVRVLIIFCRAFSACFSKISFLAICGSFPSIAL